MLGDNLEPSIPHDKAASHIKLFKIGVDDAIIEEEDEDDDGSSQLEQEFQQSVTRTQYLPADTVPTEIQSSPIIRRTRRASEPVVTAPDEDDELAGGLLVAAVDDGVELGRMTTRMADVGTKVNLLHLARTVDKISPGSGERYVRRSAWLYWNLRSLEVLFE